MSYQPATFVELLRWRAYTQPERLACTFLRDGESEEISLTYEALDRRARAIGVWLQSVGAEGERVLLLYPAGVEFIAAFFGCLYAGAIAVPVYPPRARKELSRLEAIMADAQATVALTIAPILSRVEPLLTQASFLQEMRWAATDSFGDIAEHWREPVLDGSTLAFLQYTSGSTAAPKGVMVSHGNLLHNEQMIQKACGHTEQSTFVGWLPLYHDMGLIGNVLQPIYVGARSVLMSPLDFLQRPVRWLQAITRFKARSSGGPNFAYDLCVRKITPEQRGNLDLSSWSLAFNGAEPIRPETIERFIAAFGSCGFRREAFYPCYGLAEATLFVSGGSKALHPVVRTFQSAALEYNQVAVAVENEGNRTIAGCGHAWLGQQIVIADPETLTRCLPDQVGEILVSGPSVAQGYWRKPDETKRTFQAYLADTGEGPFLCTGDLGFLQDSELFVTGRLKDLIIIRGHNYYPQDIEQIAEQSHSALRPSCSAAFSVNIDSEERLVIVAEIERRYSNLCADEVVETIRRAVIEQYGAQVHGIALIKSGSIPRTTSGKIKRHACREGFLTGTLNIISISTLGDLTEVEPGVMPVAYLATTLRSDADACAERVVPEKNVRASEESPSSDVSTPPAQHATETAMYSTPEEVTSPPPADGSIPTHVRCGPHRRKLTIQWPLMANASRESYEYRCSLELPSRAGDRTLG